MAAVKEIYQLIDNFAPFETQMDFDNAGFLVGRGDSAVERVLVALDITKVVVEEAVRRGCQLIVAHHPVIFGGVKSVTDETVTGRVLLAMAENGLSAICAHTNLDAAEGGVGDCLAQRLGLTDTVLLEQDGTDRRGRAYGIGRIGQAHKAGVSCAEYAAYVKEKLGARSVRFEDAGIPVSRVAVGGGSCGSMMEQVRAAGCDTFVTADVKYDVFLSARAMGINLIDAGHYATENVVCPTLAKLIAQAFPRVEVLMSADHREVYRDV